MILMNHTMFLKFIIQWKQNMFRIRDIIHRQLYSVQILKE